MSKKEEIVKQDAAIAVSNEIDFSQYAGAGMEGADSDTYAIPFLVCLHPLSPVVANGQTPGAAGGKIYNNISGEIYDSIEVIPCAYQRRFIGWAPRSQGGGFKGEYMPHEVEAGQVAGLSKYDSGYFMNVPAGIDPLDAKGKPLYDQLKDTRAHFVLYLDKDGTWKPACISMASTQIKRSKRWMSMINGLEMALPSGKRFTPPSFAHSYVLTTEQEQNAEGNTWWSWVVRLKDRVADNYTFDKARAFHDDVVKGAVAVQHQSEESVPAEAQDGQAF